ncbi:MAG: urease accessory protein [Actinomycetota bacterium]|nr:urease accessory protein [Actinomycetota bacterium]
MIARARVVVEVGPDGRSRLTCLRSEGPLVVRPTPEATSPGVVVHLVGGAGGPLGGDVLTIEVVVGPGAGLTVRTVAAAVVLPGPGPAPSQVSVDAHVGDGGLLHWLPEPTVAASRCRHRTRARVVLGPGARLRWREELVGGRYGEDGGSVSSRLSVDLDGRALLRHRLDLGPDHPAWASPSVGCGSRCAGSLLVVEPDWDAVPPGPMVLEATSAVLPLAGPAVHVVALAPDAGGLRRLLDAGSEAVERTPAPA